MCTEELDKLALPGNPRGEREQESPRVRAERGLQNVQERQVQGPGRQKNRQNSGEARATPGIDKSDLRAFERKSKGKRNIVYALDASGSMKGQEAHPVKKSGHRPGLQSHPGKGQRRGSRFREGRQERRYAPPPTSEPSWSSISSVSARERTNLAATIKEGVNLFPDEEATKHLVLITDAMPTSGDKPEKDTIEAAAALAKESGVTISVVGIDLNREGRAIARKIVEISKGRIFVARSPDEIDSIVLEDYYRT